MKIKTSTVVQIVWKTQVFALGRTLEKKGAEKNTSCKTACFRFCIFTLADHKQVQKLKTPIPLNQPTYHNQQNQQK